MKYTSKKGTVITIPDGLTAKQIAQIKADADAGYGTRAQKTADSLGQKSSTKKGSKTIVDSNSGTVNLNNALEATRAATDQTLTDQYGNSRTVHTDPKTGAVTVSDSAGGTAQTFKNLAEAAASTFNGAADRTRAEDATYNTLTKYYDRDEAREMEAQKQELAERGIPYDPAAAQDPNTKNLYGRTIGGISQKYQGLRSDAANQAVLAGNSAYATNASARDSFLSALSNGAQTFGGQFQPYQSTSGQDTKDLTSLSSAAFLQKYGIDKDTYIKQQAINKSGAKSSSGGSSSGGGFEIVG